jgi:hypothetical protein
VRRNTAVLPFTGNGKRFIYGMYQAPNQANANGRTAITKARYAVSVREMTKFLGGTYQPKIVLKIASRDYEIEGEKEGKKYGEHELPLCCYRRLSFGVYAHTVTIRPV